MLPVLKSTELREIKRLRERERERDREEERAKRERKRWDLETCHHSDTFNRCDSTRRRQSQFKGQRHWLAVTHIHRPVAGTQVTWQDGTGSVTPPLLFYFLSEFLGPGPAIDVCVFTGVTTNCWKYSQKLKLKWILAQLWTTLDTFPTLKWSETALCWNPWSINNKSRLMMTKNCRASYSRIYNCYAPLLNVLNYVYFKGH